MKLPASVRKLLGLGVEERSITALPWDVGGPVNPGPVSAEQALSLVPVFASVRLLSTQIASMPLQTFRQVGDTRVKLPIPSLFSSPSVIGTTFDWLHRCVTSLALRGNAYGLITQRDNLGYPTMIEWLHPDHVQVQDKAFSGPGSFTDPIWYWRGRTIPPEQMVHIPWFTVPYRVKGLSPMEACAAAVSTGISAQEYTANWFANGAVPPGVFKNIEKTIGQTEAEEIKSRLARAIQTRKPLVHGNDWQYTPIAVAAHEAKFIETLKLNATQIANIYGVPPSMVGGDAGASGMTYRNEGDTSLDFVKFTVRPWLELLEEKFSAQVPRGQYIRFNLDALLRADLTQRVAAYQELRNIGAINVDEIRAREDLPPLPDGQGQDYTPLLVMIAQSRGVEAAQITADKGSGPQVGQLAGEDLVQPARLRAIVGYDYEAEELPGIDAGPKGAPLSGAHAVIALEARRHDPADPLALERKFSPLEPRRPDGKWGSGGGHALKDALKLGDNADLQPGENLVGSDKVNGEFGAVRMALVDHGGQKSLRLGIGDETFGGRHDETGPWRAGPDRTQAINAERKKLSDETDALERELNGHPTPERKAAIEKRLTELDNTDTAEVAPAGYTANVDQQSADHLRSTLADALAQGEREAARRNAVFDELERLQKEQPSSPRIDQLQHEANQFKYTSFAEGSIPGQWADVHYEVFLDDPSVGVEVHLGAVPHGSGRDLNDLVGNQQGATLTPAEAKKLLKLLGQYAGSTQATRAAGVDTHPGDAEQLQEYWTKGEGLAKWAESPKPWTTLVAHLVKFMPLDEAKRTATEWFHDVFGFYPGSDLNRVTHGKPPRGHVVGPG